MSRLLEKSRRPKCLHPGNECWYVDADGMCANAGRVHARFDPCEHNGWGLMPTEVMASPELGWDAWRKEHGL